MTYLADLLTATHDFGRRFVVVGSHELTAIALWNAHTYVYDTAYATPYLHPFSPEPGSGKTTLLDVLSLTACAAIQADNLTEAVLFRLIQAEHPTLLFDEVDAVFSKKNSDSSVGIQQVLNSGYRKGKKAWRCVPPSHEARGFDVYCPKATAGLNELPGTLAHRSIPIAMKPPLPSDRWEDFDPEEAQDEAETLRINLQSWADEAEAALRDPRLKPGKLEGLDARGNEIWRILFRIADQAGGEWPERARAAALELSGTANRLDDASTNVRLLGAIRDVFSGERMFCRTLADGLNADEQMPYGGWSDGKGITARELGWKLKPYGVKANTIRLGETKAKGYTRSQFEDAWSRYLAPDPPTPTKEGGQGGQPASLSQEQGFSKGGQTASVPLVDNDANRDEQVVVPLVPLFTQGYGEEGLTEEDERLLATGRLDDIKRRFRGAS